MKYRGDETEWIDLQTCKDANPIETAEFAISNGLDQEPAFVWWVPKVMKHRKKIISKVKSKYWKTTHMYGICLPHLVEQALQLDKDNNSDYWTKAIMKENARVKISWHAANHLTPEQVREGRAKEMIGH